MITQEQFNKIESQYSCGYWNVCWEHACPCAIVTEHKGLQEEIYYGLIAEAQKIADSFENEDEEDYNDYLNEDDNDDDYEFDDYWNDNR